MQTDVIANELAVRLFLFGLVPVFVFEAMKATRPARWVLYGFSAIFFLATAFLGPLNRAWPVAVQSLSDLAVQPVSWLVLAALAFIVARSLWTPRYDPQPSPAAPAEIADTAAISEAVARLDERIGNFAAKLDGVIEGAKGRFEKLEADQERVNTRLGAVADAVTHQVAQGFIERVNAGIAEGRKQNATAIMPMYEGRTLNLARAQATGGLKGFGLTDEQIAERVQQHRAKIEQGARYFVLEEGEKERWDSGEEKAAWHGREAEMVAYESLLNEARAALRFDPGRYMRDVKG